MSVADLPSQETELSASSVPALQFPLAFTPFERLMLLDDRPDYPMTIHVELVLLGQMEKEPFVQAMQQSVVRHPLLAACIGWRGRWPYWLGISEAPVNVRWHEAEPPQCAMRPTHIDLVRGPGVEAHVYVGQASTSVLVLFHHSCCDGQGARRFVFDLLRAYERIVTGPESDQRQAKVDVLLEERLKRRSEFAPGPVREVKTEEHTSAWQRVKNAVAHLTTSAEKLARPQQGKPHAPALVHHVKLGIEETANLRVRAQQEGATFNDVAVAKLMQICADWNRRYANAPETRHVRVCVPTDLRVKEDDTLPAANRTGYAFLTRSFGMMRHWPQLLSSVNGETTYIKDYRVGIDFVNNMAITQRVPLLLPALLKFGPCLTTTVLTNLGDATRRLRRRFPLDAGRAVVGGLPLDSIRVTPPVRPGTRAGFGMCVCGGRLAISVLTDPYGFDDDDAQHLLDSYVSAIREWNGMKPGE